MEKTIAILEELKTLGESGCYIKHPISPERKQALSSTIEILKRVEDKAALYGKLFDLVNITEHLRGYERIEKIRKYTTAISNYLRGK